VTVDSPEPDPSRTMTLEAFADTIIPGEKRTPYDRAVAGVSAGGGAVAAGAVDLLETPAGGMVEVLDTLAAGLNEHAAAYAAEHAIRCDDSVPAFVALDFADRTALVQRLVAPGNPEREMWVGLVMFSVMAWDTGAQMSIGEAFATGHPGLLTMGFERPDADGLWRFPRFSYGRRLADPHPHTTPTGSPA
jgi:enediyne biosynthesis protein E8